MAVKKCCIDNCYSSSSRHEDVGVTYHKFPKGPTLCSSWVQVTHIIPTNIEKPAYVCSRHFCRSDFQVYQESKYVLKSEAIPSIFSWTMADKSEIASNDDEDIFENNHSDKINTSNDSKESEPENLDEIKKFIEEQQINSPQIKDNVDNKSSDELGTMSLNTLDVIHKGQEEPDAVATKIMILSESEAKVDERKEKILKSSSSPDKGTVALSVGSKVEAKDFSGLWYAAEIVEVDYDEMEVLVHYEIATNKHDEWISVSSSRLRPYNPKAVKAEVSEPQMAPKTAQKSVETPAKDDNTEEKNKLTYVVGERCLARWRDNRRFMATILNDFGNENYEVIFDDGFHWKCTTARLYKLKDSSLKTSELSVDTSMSPTSSSLASPVAAGTGPMGTSPSPLNIPLYHTHLFDPTRDYLGSKSERREMKRKLNIKEIFNIGQKKRKVKSPNEKTTPTDRRPRVVKKKLHWRRMKKTDVEIKQEVPDAVASIIGTELVLVKKEEEDIKIERNKTPEPTSNVEEGSDKITLDDLLDNKDTSNVAMTTMSDMSDASDLNSSTDPVSKEEEKLEKFEKPDEIKHEEVIDKMKEVISKLEGGLNDIEKVESPKPDIEPEIIKVDPINTEVDINIADVDPVNVDTTVEDIVDVKVDLKPEEPIQIDTVGTSNANTSSICEGAKTEEKPKKAVSKVKKTKKLRLLQEKKVKKQVERVKNELEEMKRQVEEMRKQMLQKTEQLTAEQSRNATKEMPESFLLPGEWCCKWVDGEPVGEVQETEGEPKLDANNKGALPRKSVLVEDKRLPQDWKKVMVRRSFGQSAGKWDVVLISPDNKRFHTKHEMRDYLDKFDKQYLRKFEKGLLDFGVHLKLSRRMGWVSYTGQAPVTSSPIVKKKKLGLKKDVKKFRKIRKPKAYQVKEEEIPQVEDESVLNDTCYPTIENGYVYVGSLKVQVIDNLLRCPAEGCYKNFRNKTLIKMHIKHYHRELKKMLGATPKVLDLAYARTRPTAAEIKAKSSESKVIKVKFPRPPKREDKQEAKAPPQELRVNITPLPPEEIPKQEDSPKLRQALVPKPVKRPKVLLPVRRPDPEPVPEEVEEEADTYDIPLQLDAGDYVDFEAAISTHTVTKPTDFKKTEKKRKLFPQMAASDDEWATMNSDCETRSSFPGSGTPDSKPMEKVPALNPPVSPESNEEQKDSEMYMYTETGERIKIEHMKREEIINCHCGFREEDGLMVQCELCMCWQHALCHNIHKESEVPDKYTCSICLNPKRGRRSKRFLHDQDRLYEGLLPGVKPCEFLRRSHELSGNLLRIQDALHAMRVKCYVASKKDHPKLYLWAKDWENAEINFTQERLNSDYSDLNIIINNIGKENMPMKTGQLDSLDDDERLTPRESSQLNLSGSLSGIVPLEFPITTSELERMARSIQEQEPRVIAPQPEAAIENSACRERLLRHVQRCQALIDARLDSIEAQVAELESQDPSFEDDETADYFPRTKQTIQMLMRDLETMEELGVVT